MLISRTNNIGSVSCQLEFFSAGAVGKFCRSKLRTISYSGKDTSVIVILRRKLRHQAGCLRQCSINIYPFPCRKIDIGGSVHSKCTIDVHSSCLICSATMLGCGVVRKRNTGKGRGSPVANTAAKSRSIAGEGTSGNLCCCAGCNVGTSTADASRILVALSRVGCHVHRSLFGIEVESTAGTSCRVTGNSIATVICCIRNGFGRIIHGNCPTDGSSVPSKGTTANGSTQTHTDRSAMSVVSELLFRPGIVHLFIVGKGRPADGYGHVRTDCPATAGSFLTVRY